MRSTIATSRLILSSSRSRESTSTLRTAVFAMCASLPRLGARGSLSLNRVVRAHERGDNRVELCLHFLIRQRAIGLERQAQRQADFALRHAFALIAIEEAHARQQTVRAGGLKGATNDFGRQGGVDDDRQIADDKRM